MSEWRTEPLINVLEFREGPGIMAVDFVESGVPLVRLAGLKRGAHLLDSCNYLDPEKVEVRWNQFRLKRGDVLLSTSASLGEVATVSAEGVGAIPYTGIVAFRPRGHAIDASFIPQVLTAPSFRTQIEAMGVGSVIKHFGPSHLRQMKITYPGDRAEQRAIAGILRALDDKIAIRDGIITTSDLLAAAIAESAFIPARVPISTVAMVTMGSSPPGSSYNDRGVGTPFYQGVRDFGVHFPECRVWTTSPVRLADAMDTLLSVRAPVGRTNLSREELCLGRGLAGLRSKEGRPMTLFHQIRAAHDAWRPYEAEGTVFGSINRAQLEAILVPTVDDSKAAWLEGQLAALEAHIAAIILENGRLTQTRDELLPLLMSGKVRVRDAERVVSEAL